MIGEEPRGAETADYLGQLGYRTAVVEMREDIALDDAEATRRLLFRRYEEEKVKTYVGAKVTRVYEDGVDYETDGQVASLRGFDNIILSLGVRSYNPLEEQLKGRVPQLITAGDAASAQNAVNAIYTGAVAGTTI